jgi:hypothetical protein
MHSILPIAITATLVACSDAAKPSDTQGPTTTGVTMVTTSSHSCGDLRVVAHADHCTQRGATAPSVDRRHRRRFRSSASDDHIAFIDAVGFVLALYELPRQLQKGPSVGGCDIAQLRAATASR